MARKKLPTKTPDSAFDAIEKSLATYLVSSDLDKREEAYVSFYDLYRKVEAQASAAPGVLSSTVILKRAWSLFLERLVIVHSILSETLADVLPEKEITIFDCFSCPNRRNSECYALSVRGRTIKNGFKGGWIDPKCALRKSPITYRLRS